MNIESKAPIRVDLAGGTIDIWPLYLFVPDALTINLGIDLFAETQIQVEEGQGSGVLLKSEDQACDAEFPWSQMAHLQLPQGLKLHSKLLNFFFEKKKALGWKGESDTFLKLSTKARSPAGAGLGGSSALAISMAGALARWCYGWDQADIQKNGTHLIEIVRDIESQVLQVPAGLQDYYGATFGGLQKIQWGIGSHERTAYDPSLLQEVSSRILLFYSGHSRNSGINNWAVYKGLIDRDPGITEKFKQICHATRELDHALLSRDWNSAVKAISREWSARKTLSSGISTPEMDAAYLDALKETQCAFKVCGAGGGGCFFVFLPENSPELRERVTKRIKRDGIRALPFQPVGHGLTVST